MHSKQVCSTAILLMLLVIHANASEICQSHLDKLISESIAESNVPSIMRRHKMASENLMLDLKALVYDLFLSLKDQRQFDYHKIRVIVQDFYAQLPDDFYYINDERINVFSDRALHPMANVPIYTFREMLLEKLIPWHERSPLAAELEYLRDEDCFIYALDVFDTYATKATMKKIIDLWILTNSSLLVNQKAADSTCLIQ